MLPRLILLFVFFALIVLAVKKGFGPREEAIQRIPGYPEPVALKKYVPQSDSEYLKNLPSALDYAYSFKVSERQDQRAPKPSYFPAKRKTKITKRSVAAKIKLVKR